MKQESVYIVWFKFSLLLYFIYLFCIVLHVLWACDKLRCLILKQEDIQDKQDVVLLQYSFVYIFFAHF